jgi:hypothetical protein
MSCNISNNIALNCIDSAGSIVAAYILNGPADSYVESTGNVTAITVGGNAVSSSDWFTWAVPRQTSQYTSTANVSVENGTLFYQKDLALFFNRLAADKRNEFLLAAQSNTMIVAFEDANGTKWVFGLDKPAYVSALVAGSGSTFDARSGYEVTLSTQELEPEFTIDSALLPA